jgi:hypothetical protein
MKKRGLQPVCNLVKTDRAGGTSPSRSDALPGARVENRSASRKLTLPSEGNLIG